MPVFIKVQQGMEVHFIDLLNCIDQLEIQIAFIKLVSGSIN